MNIEKIDILEWHFTPYCELKTEGLCHVKALPYLSVVQSIEGYYEVKMDNSPIYQTSEKGFFVAPAFAMQNLTHHLSSKTGRMLIRWLFIDVKINDRYKLEDIFEMPIILPPNRQAEVNDAFDTLSGLCELCDKMSVFYRIIKILLQVAVSEKKPPNAVFKKVADYMHDNFKDRLTVHDLAQIANMSESNFYLAFKKQFGKSPIAYLNGLRLTLASNMLKYSDEPISEIASAVGFEDPFYFSKIFKSEFQVSPRQYRNKHSIENI